jgi:hypothetical protein
VDGYDTAVSDFCRHTQLRRKIQSHAQCTQIISLLSARYRLSSTILTRRPSQSAMLIVSSRPPHRLKSLALNTPHHQNSLQDQDGHNKTQQPIQSRNPPPTSSIPRRVVLITCRSAQTTAAPHHVRAPLAPQLQIPHRAQRQWQLNPNRDLTLHNISVLVRRSKSSRGAGGVRAVVLGVASAEID